MNLGYHNLMLLSSGVTILALCICQLIQCLCA
uniref:Uncharacterized protein n=1 Tax=Arundo donax TaxID=35708 RepID=A0A0A9B4J7_ARUDO